MSHLLKHISEAIVYKVKEKNMPAKKQGHTKKVSVKESPSKETNQSNPKYSRILKKTQVFGPS